MNTDIISAVLEEKLIVIVRGADSESLILLAEAMYAGGVRLLELTYDSTGKTPDSVTADNISRLVKHFEGRMHIGAGTVTKTSQVEATAAAGGKFIISPDTSVEVIRKTKELGLISMPGAMTPTEIQTAHRAGADFVKLFPASAFDPSYVKAVRAPLSHIKLLAVGGIDLNNMADYANVGVSGFGIGSNITDKKLIAAGDFAAITALAERYVAKIKEIYK